MPCAQRLLCDCQASGGFWGTNELSSTAPSTAGLVGCTMREQIGSVTLGTGQAMATETVRYFAYGSNMLTDRLRERVPSATAIGVGRLAGHQLRWDKRTGRDGSGKCDAQATRPQDNALRGVGFTLDPT